MGDQGSNFETVGEIQPPSMLERAKDFVAGSVNSKAVTGLAVLACSTLVGCSMPGSSEGKDPHAEATPAETSGNSELANRAGNILDANAESVGKLAIQLKPGAFPYYTQKNGSWKTTSREKWTSGFFPGTLWEEYKQTGRPELKAQAKRWTAPLEKQQYNDKNHDAGFQLTPFREGYEQTKDSHYKQVLLKGASSLASRYDPDVKATRSWGPKTGKKNFSVIMDNMMNTELLYWGAKHGGKQEWKTMAKNHAVTTMKSHFRPDGSVYQLVKFNPQTGKAKEKTNVQGYNKNSVWARGQSWAVAGFTNAYQETHDKRFLKTARKASDYFINHLPEDKVPYWDFKAPRIPNEPKDSSAAAIAAGGMLELSRVDPDKKHRQKYFASAEDILESLSDPGKGYLADIPKSNHLLNHGTQNAKSKEQDHATSYGDYYLTKALMRYRQIAK